MCVCHVRVCHVSVSSWHALTSHLPGGPSRAARHSTQLTAHRRRKHSDARACHSASCLPACLSLLSTTLPAPLTDSPSLLQSLPSVSRPSLMDPFPSSSTSLPAGRQLTCTAPFINSPCLRRSPPFIVKSPSLHPGFPSSTPLPSSIPPPSIDALPSRRTSLTPHPFIYPPCLHRSPPSIKSPPFTLFLPHQFQYPPPSIRPIPSPHQFPFPFRRPSHTPRPSSLRVHCRCLSRSSASPPTPSSSPKGERLTLFLTAVSDCCF